MNDSRIIISPHATTYAGRDAVDLMRARVLASSLKLYAKCGLLPTRTMKITALLKLATAYTGRPYKRSEAMRASDDVFIWANNFALSLPHIVEE